MKKFKKDPEPSTLTLAEAAGILKKRFTKRTPEAYQIVDEAMRNNPDSIREFGLTEEDIEKKAAQIFKRMAIDHPKCQNIKRLLKTTSIESFTADKELKINHLTDHHVSEKTSFFSLMLF